MMITSIGQLLEQMGVTTRVFDLGRHVREIGADTFAQFEQQAIAYPAPYLHHAWIGLLFWDPDTPEIPLLWFIKLPLDEQARLIPSQRDQFLKQLMVALGSNIEAAKQGKQLAAVLEGNPYVFTPTPERQAVMHAKAKQLLKLPASDHYLPATDYLTSDLGQWQHLGLQGIADLAVRWPQHQAELALAIPKMPAEPLIHLGLCLENEAINGAISKSIQQRVEQELIETSLNSGLIAALIRGVSQSQAMELRHRLLAKILESSASDSVEIIAAIGTRCGTDLAVPELCLSFLEALCQHDQQSFNRVMADLLFCAPIRPHILAAFRNPQRSERLAAAIGALLAPAEAEAGTSSEQKTDQEPPSTLH